MLQATRLNCYNNVLYKVYINPFNPTENGIQCAELKPENLKILIILTMIIPLQRTYTKHRTQIFIIRKEGTKSTNELK